MPVTAKLSRTFYEKFGDEATNELVEWLNAVDAAYRTDLREFNEINFGRFDSKLTERLAQSDAQLEKRLAGFERKIEDRLNGFERKIEDRLDAFEKTIEGRLAGFEAQTTQRFMELDQKIETRALSLRTEIAYAKTEMVRWMFGFWIATVAMIFLAKAI